IDCRQSIDLGRPRLKPGAGEDRFSVPTKVRLRRTRRQPPTLAVGVANIGGYRRPREGDPMAKRKGDVRVPVDPKLKKAYDDLLARIADATKHEEIVVGFLQL